MCCIRVLNPEIHCAGVYSVGTGELPCAPISRPARCASDPLMQRLRESSLPLLQARSTGITRSSSRRSVSLCWYSFLRVGPVLSEARCAAGPILAALLPVDALCCRGAGKGNDCADGKCSAECTAFVGRRG